MAKMHYWFNDATAEVLTRLLPAAWSVRFVGTTIENECLLVLDSRFDKFKITILRDCNRFQFRPTLNDSGWRNLVRCEKPWCYSLMSAVCKFLQERSVCYSREFANSVFNEKHSIGSPGNTAAENFFGAVDMLNKEDAGKGKLRIMEDGKAVWVDFDDLKKEKDMEAMCDKDVKERVQFYFDKQVAILRESLPKATGDEQHKRLSSLPTARKLELLNDGDNYALVMDVLQTFVQSGRINATITDALEQLSTVQKSVEGAAKKVADRVELCLVIQWKMQDAVNEIRDDFNLGIVNAADTVKAARALDWMDYVNPAKEYLESVNEVKELL